MKKSKSLHLFFALIFSVLLLPDKMQGQCNPKSDSLELVKLYNATDGDNWKININWKIVGQPISTWYGVFVNDQGCIDSIELSSNRLKGFIPNFSLPNLQSLNLERNQLTGSIPNFNLPNLTDLLVSGNELSGTIPDFNLPKLEDFTLSHTNIGGTIPNFNLPNLKRLYLGDNQLTGTIPNFNLPSLQELTLQEHQLSGTIPNFNLPKLETLWIQYIYKLSGTIPNFNLPNLQTLFLGTTVLSGTIPNFNLPNLVQLTLSGNQLNGNIPDFNLPKLQYLTLENNQLSGSIPNFNLPKLASLDLTDNRLSGSIPNFKLPKLNLLRLLNNQLSGCIPKELKINCPLFEKGYCNISNNPNLATQNWKDYWEKGEGACGTVAVNTNNCRYQDSLVLVDLYKATNGANWKNKWDLTKPMDTWYGVSINEEGCVVQLGLPQNNLKGNLPNLDLKNLEAIFFSANQLSGSIPDFNLPNLIDLTLDDNQLSGSIPQLNLPNLQVLHLHDNQLSGSIPNFNLPKLEVLVFRNNKLSGLIPNFNLPKLRYLSLDGNDLSGCIPNELKTNCPLLKDGGTISDNPNLATQSWKNYWEKGEGACGTVAVNTNNCRYQDSLVLVDLYKATDGSNWKNKWDLTKPMDTWYGVFVNKEECVDSINLAVNELKGYIPNLNLPNLKYLNMELNSLKGTIPNFNLPKLEFLNMRNTLINGLIPNFNLVNLQELILAHNFLNGSIPNFDLPSLTTLKLDGNQLSGSVPNFNLPNLTCLDIGDNQLSGSVPNFNLPNLISLDLPINQLSGSIPNFSLPNLTRLNLAGNQLSGSIPNFNLPSLDILHLRNNQLSGTIPNFNLHKLEYLHIENNQLSGCIPLELKIKCPLIKFCDISKNPNLATQDWKSYWEKGEGACGIANSVVDTNTCRYRDSIALVNLYRATNGAYWFNKWDLTKPMNTWHNVVLNEGGCVQSLSLINNGLSGTIPNLTLPNLESLFLDNNQLNGTIPNLDLPNLRELHLSFNKLSGTIPDFELPNLQELWLNNNQLTGAVPNFKLAKLRSLRLSFNQFSGAIPNAHPRGLEELWLDNNQLSGSIPKLNLPKLQVLHLDMNQLSDTIPNFDLPELKIIALNHNQLTGSIPNFVLPNLQVLSLYYNRLSGIIPNFNLPNLESLLLSNNQLSGAIPNFKLPKLRQLHLGFNLLSNVVPSFVMANLQSLSLSSNQLSGSVPNLDLPNLQSLYLYENKLSGTIPNLDLPKLQLLYLNDNQLTGDIPNLNLPNLEAVSLDNNQVSGSIPIRQKKPAGFRFKTSDNNNKNRYQKMEDAPIEIVPDTISLRPFCPLPISQGSELSCTFWASIHGAMSISHAINRKAKTPEDISKITFSKSYAFNQLADSINQSISHDDIFKFLKEKGTCYATTFKNPTPLDQKPDSLAIKEATNYTLDPDTSKTKNIENDTRKSIDIRINNLKHLLIDSIPVVIIVRYIDDLRNISGKLRRLNLDQLNDTPTDTAHAMCLIGYDDRDSTFEVMNSWYCGDNGFGKIHYMDMLSILISHHVLHPKFEKKQTMVEIVFRQRYEADNCTKFKFSELRLKLDTEKNIYKPVRDTTTTIIQIQMVLRKVPLGWSVYRFHTNTKGEIEVFYEGTSEKNSIDKVLPSENVNFKIIKRDRPEYMGVLLSKTPLSNFKEKIKAIKASDLLMTEFKKAFKIKELQMMGDRMGVMNTEETPKIVACVLRIN